MLFSYRTDYGFVRGEATHKTHNQSYGAALVSTGAVRQDKRAEVSDLLKPGNFFKIN